jgi:predicted CoA-binding protein
MSRGATRDEFFDQAQLALVVGRHQGAAARRLARSLAERDVVVHPVVSGRASVTDGPVYASLREVPEPVGGVIVLVDPTTVMAVVDDCVARGVERVWLQPVPGSDRESYRDAATTCRAHGIRVLVPERSGLGAATA